MCRMPYLPVLLHHNKVHRASNNHQLQALKLCYIHCTRLVQVEMLHRDNARLTSENNQLHLQLLRESEKVDAAASEGYQASRRLQSQITELTYWKQQTVERFVELEKENAGLKGRINDLLRLGERTPRRETKHFSADLITFNTATSDHIQAASSLLMCIELDCCPVSAAADVALREAGSKINMQRPAGQWLVWLVIQQLKEPALCWMTAVHVLCGGNVASDCTSTACAGFQGIAQLQICPCRCEAGQECRGYRCTPT